MKHICCIILCFCTSIGSFAQNFADYFQNKTLRVDYIFTGDATQQAIYLDELSQLPTWAGRQHHLSELPLEGNGQIIVKDLASKQCIYKTSFSSLFQTNHVKRINRLQHVYLMVHQPHSYSNET